tara:strand:- start:6921 stop:7463 length:543 start_codon:yes stop_codon:yes gene_type:complete
MRTFSGTLLQQYFEDLSVGSLQSQLHAIGKLRDSVEENEGHLCVSDPGSLIDLLGGVVRSSEDRAARSALELLVAVIPEYNGAGELESHFFPTVAAAAVERMGSDATLEVSKELMRALAVKIDGGGARGGVGRAKVIESLIEHGYESLNVRWRERVCVCVCVCEGVASEYTGDARHNNGA